MFSIYPSVIDNDAKTFFNRLSAPSLADGDYLTAINNLIISLKSEGIWTGIDVLCLAAPAEADSLLNLTGTDYSGSKVGTPTFTAKQGFTCSNAGSDYIDSNYIPETGGQNWTQDDHFCMSYFLGNFSGQALGTAFYVRDSLTSTITHYYKNTTVISSQETSAAATNTVHTIETGMWLLARPDGTQYYWANGDTRATIAVASLTKTWAETVTIGGSPYLSWEPDEICSAWGMGSWWGSAEADMDTLKTILNTYMTAVGAI